VFLKSNCRRTHNKYLEYTGIPYTHGPDSGEKGQILFRGAVRGRGERGVGVGVGVHGGPSSVVFDICRREGRWYVALESLCGAMQ